MLVDNRWHLALGGVPYRDVRRLWQSLRYWTVVATAAKELNEAVLYHWPITRVSHVSVLRGHLSGFMIVS